MTALTLPPPRARLIAPLLLLAAVATAWWAKPAPAAQLEHQQVVAGLHSATLEARVDPEGEASSCQAQYVSESRFEAGGWGASETVACEPEELGAGTEPVSASARLEGLALSTTYRYRFLLTTAAGATPAGEGRFSTFGIEIFSFRTLGFGEEPDTQAGSHPYEIVAKIVAPTTEVEISEPRGGSISPTGTIKNVINELPPGLVGDPTAVPTCTVREAEEQKCSGDAQVGLLEVRYGERTDEEAAAIPSALYNVVAPQGRAARFAGFVNASTDGFIDSGVRTGDDYGISSGGFNISARSNLFAITVRLWGVPADPRHDARRFCPTTGSPQAGCASNAEELPFLRNPTSCAGPLTVRARLDSYQSPGEYAETQATLPTIMGCDQLDFDPEMEVRPTSEVAASPTGLHADLRIPQDEDPKGLATADLREVVVKLPVGFTLNPSSANGLTACTPAQFGLTTTVGAAPIHTTAAPASCPDAAKIGTVEVETPLLDHTLSGAVYVAQPYQNPFGSLLAIYVTIDDVRSGVVVKLAGDVEIGSDGQLTTTFADNPQLPFESFKIDFFGGDLAALKTPALCGSYEATSSLTPWSAPESGPPATSAASLSVSAPPGGGCSSSAAQMPNRPVLEAGAESPIAGAFSPFVLRIKREDGSQQFRSISVTPPPGLLGRLAGIPYCPDFALAAVAAKTGAQEQAAATCPVASEVGVINVGVGAGSSPYYAQGKVYLAGPYKRAPLSLAFVTPAVAGPFDLGTVVVRSALEVNPYTAQITVKSDPIPSELKQIPLDVRSIAVKMDRPQFTLNPTNCEAMSVAGTETSTLGNTVQFSTRFRVGGCKKLGFKPRLAFSLKGAPKRTGHPAVTAWLRMPDGGANIAAAQVSLPHTELLDQGNLDKVCTQPEIATASCPPRSIYGFAKAWSPLLDKPLTGPVFLGVGYGHDLPDLVAELNGQIRVLLHGRIDTNKAGGLRNTFEVVPDAPVSKFMLRLKGGAGYGLLENSESLCSRTRHVAARFLAQSGRVAVLHPRIVTSCKRHENRKHHGRR
jgi:hypothetical protein